MQMPRLAVWLLVAAPLLAVPAVAFIGCGGGTAESLTCSGQSCNLQCQPGDPSCAATCTQSANCKVDCNGIDCTTSWSIEVDVQHRLHQGGRLQHLVRGAGELRDRLRRRRRVQPRLRSAALDCQVKCGSNCGGGCTGNASCGLTCDNDCHTSCTGNSACHLACKTNCFMCCQGSGECTLDCSGADTTECPGGHGHDKIIVCGRECPDPSACDATAQVDAGP